MKRFETFNPLKKSSLSGCPLALILSYVLLAVAMLGCQKNETSVAVNETKEPTREPSSKNAVQESNQVSVAEAKTGVEIVVAANEQDANYWEKVKSLYERAKESGETSATNVSEWISDTYQTTKESTTDFASDTSDTIAKWFESAKEQGSTTAKNAEAWLKEEWEKMGTFEYKYALIESDPQSQLDKLGKDRWNLVCIDNAIDKRFFVLKRPVKSQLEKIPTRDLVKLLPMLVGI